MVLGPLMTKVLKSSRIPQILELARQIWARQAPEAGLETSKYVQFSELELPHPRVTVKRCNVKIRSIHLAFLTWNYLCSKRQTLRHTSLHLFLQYSNILHYQVRKNTKTKFDDFYYKNYAV